jgi:hypothetical protein
VRVQNAGEDPSVFTVNVQALDAGGTIVGSNEYTMPTIDGHGSFDLFDQLGGNVFVTLTGTPTKVAISRFEPAMNAELPLLPSSELKLAHVVQVLVQHRLQRSISGPSASTPGRGQAGRAAGSSRVGLNRLRNPLTRTASARRWPASVTNEPPSRSRSRARHATSPGACAPRATSSSATDSGSVETGRAVLLDHHPHAMLAVRWQ